MLLLGAASSAAESSLTRPLVFSDSQLLEPVGKWELPLWAQSAPANAYVNGADAEAFGAPQRKAFKYLCGLPQQLKRKEEGEQQKYKTVQSKHL